MSTYRMLSIVVPVQAERPGLAETHRRYREGLEGLGYSLQFVYVVDGPHTRSLEALKELKRQGESLEILSLAQPFGEATALSTGFKHVKGDLILTLPDEPQVAIEALPKLLEAVDGSDVVVARRSPPDGMAPGGQRKFEYVAKLLLGSEFSDLRCGVRVLKRPVIEEITLYGNQHHFFPLIAQTHGFTIKEVEVRAARAPRRSLRPKLTLLLDLLTAYFLIRFIKKPFRFFGGFGFAVLALGGLVTAYLVLARLLFGEPLVDRPALILSSLMVVLGIQIISVGLIGEIITFAFTKEQKEYKIEKIVE